MQSLFHVLGDWFMIGFTFYAPQLFQFSSKVQVSVQFFTFFHFHLLKQQNSIDNKFFVFVLLKTRSDLLAWMGVIHLYLQILQNFMCFILNSRFWFVHIPFISMLKFQSIAQFPVGHLPQSIIPVFLFLLS